MTRRIRLHWKLKSAGRYPQITQITQILNSDDWFVGVGVIRGSVFKLFSKNNLCNLCNLRNLRIRGRQPG